MFNATEVFDPNFASVYSTLLHIVCAISITLTSLLIYIITTKTPQFMKNLKVYFIPYCINIIVVKFVFAIYTPIFLHPFTFFYPVGLAKNFPLKLSLLILLCGAFSALSLIDCCIGILMERAYALRTVEILTNNRQIRLPYTNIALAVKPPLLVFLFLTFSCFVCFICGILIIFNNSFYSSFFVLPENIYDTVSSKIVGLEDVLDLNVIVVIQSSQQIYVPYFGIFGCLVAICHLFIAAQLILYNGCKSRSLKYLMSPETKRNNAILLRMTYFQFLGFFFFLGCPLLTICLTYRLIQKPIMYVNYCIVIMNCFSIYDTVVTILCIKPYRTFVFSLFKKRSWNKKQITVIIPNLYY